MDTQYVDSSDTFEEHSSDHSNHSDDIIGIIYGDVDSTHFKCNITAPLEKAEYIQVHHETCGMVLGRVDDIKRHTNLSMEKANMMSEGRYVDIQERISADIEVVGYRDEKGLLQVPRSPFKAGTPIQMADNEFIKEVVGMKGKTNTGAFVGKLFGHDIPVYIDINTMVQKHLSVLAKTGGGKSYVTGVLVEELMKHDVTTIVVDPHGEYNAMKNPAERSDGMDEFGVSPQSYGHKIMEFSPDTKINPDARPLQFTLNTLGPRELLDLTGIKNTRTAFTVLKKAMEMLKKAKPNYGLIDLIHTLEADEDGGAGNSTLINELEYLREINIFAERGTRLDELVVKGKMTVLNLKGTPPDIQQLIVNRLATALFELRKLNEVPPLIMIMEEAHNYCPQQGTVASSGILRTIASEGRKFGLGMAIITQRAAKVDKNVLSQCNTQVILKITNPLDLKAITSSVEGLSAGMSDDIQNIPLGVAIMTGGGLSMPLFVQIRTRETTHGGASVKVIED